MRLSRTLVFLAKLSKLIVASSNGTVDTTGLECHEAALMECNYWYRNDCPALAYKKDIKESEARECECFGPNSHEFYTCNYDFITDNCNTDENVKKMKKALVENCSAFEIVELQVVDECGHYLDKHYPKCAAEVIAKNLPEYLDSWQYKWEQQCPSEL